MASIDNRFTIVVGIDLSEMGDLALDQAFELATQRENTDVHVVFVEDELTAPRVHAADPTDTPHTSEMLERVRQRASDRLSELAKRIAPKMRHVIAHLRRGSPAENIVQLAAHLDADLIVVGTHGRRGIERLLLGSVAERVLRLARCPVWIVRPKDHENAGKVPDIEPPCPDCVMTRQATSGASLWCARHSEHHIRPHTYHYVSTGMYTDDRTATRSGETTPNQTH